MKAGQFHKGFAVVDPTKTVLSTGTVLHAMLFAKSRGELDALITRKHWTRNDGYYFAPSDFTDQRLAIPTVSEYKGYQPAHYLIAPDLQNDIILLTGNEIRARALALLMGWKKRGGVWVKE